MLDLLPLSRARLTRALALTVLLFATAAVAGAAAPFAALTVTPTGRQVFDITTGVTTMPDGGTIADRSTGVLLVAGHIEYLAGVFVKATGAQVDGDFGSVRAQSLRIDLQSGVLEASGQLSLTRDGISITASGLHYDAQREVAVFTGGVTANQPAFVAERLFLDARSGDVLLDGRYEYQDVLFTLQSPAQGGRLQLRLVLRDGQPSYDAATEVSPALLERFAELL